MLAVYFLHTGLVKPCLAEPDRSKKAPPAFPLDAGKAIEAQKNYVGVEALDMACIGDRSTVNWSAFAVSIWQKQQSGWKCCFGLPLANSFTTKSANSLLVCLNLVFCQSKINKQPTQNKTL